MGLLVECPNCKTRNSLKREKCSKCVVSLKKLAHKNYWIDFYDGNGIRCRERIGASKTAAEQRLRDVLKARTEERYIKKDPAARIMLGELFDWYLRLPEVIAKASFIRDTCSIKNLQRILGDNTKVRQLTPGKVEGYRQQRLAEASVRRKNATIAPATVNKEVICLKTILNRAVSHGKIDENPIRDLKRLIENNVRMKLLDDQEFERLVSACPEYLKPLVVLAFYTGMRKSEILFLVWDEVDIEKGFIRLNANRTKTKVARVVPLPPRVKSMLAEIPRGLVTNRVFLIDGKPFHDFKKSFRSACKATGLADFTFHDLRHCAINNLRLSGNDYFKIMAVSGHKTISVFKRYNLVTEDELNTISWDKGNAEELDPGHLYGHQNKKGHGI